MPLCEHPDGPDACPNHMSAAKRAIDAAVARAVSLRPEDAALIQQIADFESREGLSDDWFKSSVVLARAVVSLTARVAALETAAEAGERSS